ncbi:MAG: glycosyltransferase family 2 protein [Planctomycetia bacterium]|nr:glycosyltransferase family 2 protein [Planctomycetia bacterium]
MTRPAADPFPVWIVVPAYNEGSALATPLAALCQRYRHIVVIDDGSLDDTSAVAARFPVCVVRHAINLGQGAALQTGLDFALAEGAALLVTFDADGQHTVTDIETLLAPLRRGEVDVVLGSRFLGSAVGMPLHRKLTVKLGVLFTRIFSRLKITDTHNGLRAFSRAAAAKIAIEQNRMAHASEILDQVHRHRLRYCEVPVRIEYSRASLAKGQSSWAAVKIACQFLLGRILR